jgi:NAD(P)-dependent dehydrogenase (short-subunit alcohol dehydrogenase family)
VTGGDSGIGRAAAIAFAREGADVALSYLPQEEEDAREVVWTALQPSGGQTQEKVQHFGETAPLGRPGQPVELAPVYVLLASQEASFITGEVYGVTGGEGVV